MQISLVRFVYSRAMLILKGQPQRIVSLLRYWHYTSKGHSAEISICKVYME